MNKIGKFIRESRLAAKLSAPELAVKVGFGDRSYFSRVESGKIIPSIKRVKAVAKVCGVTVPKWLDAEFAEIIRGKPHMRQVVHSADYEKFVACWQKSATINDVVIEMGGTYKTVYYMAWRCRKHGVKLKRMKRGATLDWAALNKLAEESLIDSSTEAV